jgi:hypothetical protein
MYIEWTKVTWYSEVIAFILFVAIFFVGVRVGQFRAMVDRRVDSMIQASNGWMKISPTSTVPGAADGAQR